MYFTYQANNKIFYKVPYLNFWKRYRFIMENIMLIGLSTYDVYNKVWNLKITTVNKNKFQETAKQLVQ